MTTTQKKQRMNDSRSHLCLYTVYQYVTNELATTKLLNQFNLCCFRLCCVLRNPFQCSLCLLVNDLLFTCMGIYWEQAIVLTRFQIA